MAYGASAYARTAQSTMTHREAKAALLAKAANGLAAASATLAAGGPADMDALRFNQRAWVALAEPATRADGPLPSETKANVAALAAFVLRRTMEAMIEPSQAAFDALAEINRNLAAGLMGPGRA